ncbi:uncharacterized protein LOC124889776, partial [Capsicum annuum]|uniref:uncharacterized protein LOC124889776 n=1 Tax=Capsicum annuum TaxID=4072 RepID=UPI001FB0F3CD
PLNEYSDSVTNYEFSERVQSKVSCSSHNVQASVLESECLSASIEEIETLKNKAEEVEEYLDGQCVYLVGQFTDVSHANPRFIHFWYPNFGRNTGIFLFRLLKSLSFVDNEVRSCTTL